MLCFVFIAVRFAFFAVDFFMSGIFLKKINKNIFPNSRNPHEIFKGILFYKSLCSSHSLIIDDEKTIFVWPFIILN